jgi:ribosomal protein S18 acetylase RimI-like enzyme
MTPECYCRACEADAVIRRVDAADWERLRDVRLRALASDPQAFLETQEHARQLPEAHWRERAMPSEAQATFVEERDGRFAAMVAAFVANDPETAHLVSMWVAPEIRGTGVAVQLVQQVLNWAREQKRTRVVLSVEDGNEAAARLYVKCGFVEIPHPIEMPYEPNAGNRFFAYKL